MASGVVKSYLAEKGFGFINQDGDGPDMFFHSSALKPEEIAKIGRGSHVVFEVIIKKGKEQAGVVTVIEPPPQPAPAARYVRKFPQQELSALEEFEKEWNLRPAQ